MSEENTDPALSAYPIREFRNLYPEPVYVIVGNSGEIDHPAQIVYKEANNSEETQTLKGLLVSINAVYLLFNQANGIDATLVRIEPDGNPMSSDKVIINEFQFGDQSTLLITATSLQLFTTGQQNGGEIKLFSLALDTFPESVVPVDTAFPLPLQHLAAISSRGGVVWTAIWEWDFSQNPNPVLGTDNLRFGSFEEGSWTIDILAGFTYRLTSPQYILWEKMYEKKRGRDFSIKQTDDVNAPQLVTSVAELFQTYFTDWTEMNISVWELSDEKNYDGDFLFAYKNNYVDPDPTESGPRFWGIHKNHSSTLNIYADEGVKIRIGDPYAPIEFMDAKPNGGHVYFIVNGRELYRLNPTKGMRFEIDNSQVIDDFSSERMLLPNDLAEIRMFQEAKQEFSLGVRHEPGDSLSEHIWFEKNEDGTITFKKTDRDTNQTVDVLIRLADYKIDPVHLVGRQLRLVLDKKAYTNDGGLIIVVLDVDPGEVLPT